MDKWWEMTNIAWMKKISLYVIVSAFSLVVRAQAPEGVSADSLYRWHVQHGLELLEVDSLVQAEASLTEALRLKPAAKGNYLVYRYIAEIQDRRGESRQALETYTIAVNLNPRNEQLLLGRAALYFRLNQPERAFLDYNNVLDVNEECTEALFMRAFLYGQKRAYKQARADYESLLKLDPHNMQAMIGLAMTNDNDNRRMEAMEQMDVVVQLFPKEALPWAIRGGMHQERSQWEQAEADLTRAIELDPKNPDYYVSRATLYMDINERSLARRDARMAQMLGADAREMAGLLKK